MTYDMSYVMVCTPRFYRRAGQKRIGQARVKYSPVTEQEGIMPVLSSII